MARDDNDNDDGDAQRPWKKRREKGLRALSCPTMKGFASLQRAPLHARDEARRRRSGRRGGFGGKEKGEKGKGGRRDAYREERKKGRKKGERDREIKEVDDNAAVVRPLAQGAQGGHYIVLLFRAYAAISAGDRDRVCARSNNDGAENEIAGDPRIRRESVIRNASQSSASPLLLYAR